MTPEQHRMRGAYRGIALGKALKEVDMAANQLFSARSENGWDAYNLLRALRAAVREASRLRDLVEGAGE